MFRCNTHTPIVPVYTVYANSNISLLPFRAPILLMLVCVYIFRTFTIQIQSFVIIGTARYKHPTIIRNTTQDINQHIYALLCANAFGRVGTKFFFFFYISYIT